MNILLSSVLAVFFVSVVLLISQNIFAQTDVEEINQNSLVACVDYYLNLFNTNNSNSSSLLSPEAQKQSQRMFPFLYNESGLTVISTVICDLGYEHTGKYSHLLSKNMQGKYIEMAAIQILLGKIPLN
ncbi:MAG: hypothetical protein ACR2F1_15030 [Nitrososphaeraceae archaeon]